jgi:biopolymer transport protein ExbB
VFRAFAASCFSFINSPLRMQRGICLAILCCLAFATNAAQSRAQEPENPVVSQSTLDDLASNTQQAANRNLVSAPSTFMEPLPGIDFLSLLIKGGIFMIPIGLISLMAVTMAFERLINLRKSRVLPTALVAALGKLARDTEMLDPKAAYKLCQQYPSPTSNIIRTMVLKVGRPHSEIENAVKEASQREADRLYLNVRWLNLATGVAPLLGLLGTVWGLIRAFHDSTQLGIGQNRAEQLATGIYEALITTLAGLLVAIPAAIVAHYFEGKISSLFRQIDELMFHLLAQIERFEGRVRFDSIGRELTSRDVSTEHKADSSRDQAIVSVKIPKPTVSPVAVSPVAVAPLPVSKARSTEVSPQRKSPS